MKKKRITIKGVVELSDGDEEEFADAVLAADNGAIYLLDVARFGDDVYEWMDSYVKLVGWKYRDGERTFIEVVELREAKEESEDGGGEVDLEDLGLLDDDDFGTPEAWDRD